MKKSVDAGAGPEPPTQTNVSHDRGGGEPLRVELGEESESSDVHAGDGSFSGGKPASLSENRSVTAEHDGHVEFSVGNRILGADSQNAVRP